ncbi:hypothetical protein MLD38_022623 [Melastoma candidum]|uniref:Uncharacterized protein n=1 Tax=Melastoma candidum TaxID=119954 RepID=A0ACB9QNT3_9MYRT|nr:hypothetical protein MLD38_022623 [Melastoma candidum]
MGAICPVGAHSYFPSSSPLRTTLRGRTSLSAGGLRLPRSWSCRSSPTQLAVHDDLDSLLAVLPEDLRQDVVDASKRSSLVEIILDLGRLPEARYVGENGGEALRRSEVTEKELEYVLHAVGGFLGDNRAGIPGRAVHGAVNMISDLLSYAKNILFVGRPGVGKTTTIREAARVLSNELFKRVVIVDTSNEIGGDGDVPHPAIGRARRLQVPNPSLQHRVMIEAVENHMPEVVIVDEISTEAEASACQSIAARGVMLIGTAHGETIESVMKNRSLSKLVGGVQAVVLGDEEARIRGCQKIVLERKTLPTFPFLIEMRERHYWILHHTEKSVDKLMLGKLPLVEVRRLDDQLKLVVERWSPYSRMDC